VHLPNVLFEAGNVTLIRFVNPSSQSLVDQKKKKVKSKLQVRSKLANLGLKFNRNLVPLSEARLRLTLVLS